MVEIISLDPAKSTGIAYLHGDNMVAKSVKYTGFGGYMDQSVFIYNISVKFKEMIHMKDPFKETHIVIENLEAFSPQQREMVGYLKIRFHEMGYRVFDYTPKDWKQVHDYYKIDVDDKEFEYWEQFLKPNDKKDYDRKLTKIKSMKMIGEVFKLQCDDDDAADALCIAEFHRLVLEGKLTSQRGAGKRKRAEINARKKARARERNKYCLWDKKEKKFVGVDGKMTIFKSKILYFGIDTIEDEKKQLNNKNLVRIKKDKVEEKLKGI